MALDFPIFPTTGQTYSSGGQTWTFNGSGWASTYQASGVVRQIFTAAASQTSFPVVGGYLANLVDVYQNGVKLVNGTDVTVTSGTTVVLATGATVGDFVEVIGVSAFAVANYLPLAGGTLTGALLGTTATFSGAVAGTTGTLYPIVSGAVQASTSGTSITFGPPTTAAIPSWVKRITVMFTGVSTSGTNNILVQVGSGSVTTTGYLCGSTGTFAGTPSAANYTTGFGILGASAANIMHGAITICLVTGNTYVASGTFGLSSSANTFTTAGTIALSGVLDRVVITTVGGTDTFDAGSINILYE